MVLHIICNKCIKSVIHINKCFLCDTFQGCMQILSGFLVTLSGSEMHVQSGIGLVIDLDSLQVLCCATVCLGHCLTY